MRGGTTLPSTLAARRNLCADGEMSAGAPRAGDKRAAARDRGNTSDLSASSDEESGRRKRGGQGRRGSVPGEIPEFMRLSGEASESGRRSRSGSRDAALPCKGELKPGSEQCWAAQRLVRVFSSCAGLVL